MKEELFLDTTIQVDKITETDSRKRIICSYISNKDCYTCTLVLREFLERIVATTITLYELVLEKENRADIETEISRQFNKTAIMLKIWAQVERDTAIHERFDKELIVNTLQTYIEGGMEKRFRLHIKEISNMTDCDLAKEKVNNQNNCYTLKYSCNKDTALCSQTPMIQGLTQELDTINQKIQSNALQSPKKLKELKKINELIQECISEDNLNKLKGRNCNVISDLLIALEAQDHHTLYSTDNLFSDICNCLGKKHKVEKYEE